MAKKKTAPRQPLALTEEDELRRGKLGISRREYQVLALAAQGLNLRATAGALGICTGTVKLHRRNLFRLLRISCIADTFQYAEHLGVQAGTIKKSSKSVISALLAFDATIDTLLADAELEQVVSGVIREYRAYCVDLRSVCAE